MRYEPAELDVASSDSSDAVIGAADRGFGLLLRDGSRPVAFGFVEPTGRPPTARGLAPDVFQAAGLNLLGERLRLAVLDRLSAGGETGGSHLAPPSVTVTVCTRNRPDDLGICLAYISRGIAEYQGEVEVLVVDNAPADDRTQLQVNRHDGVRYVREPVAGLDVARNRALRETRAEWIVFVDDDVRVDRYWLCGLAAALEEHPDASAVTGLVLPAELESDAQVRFERRGGFGRGYDQLRWDGRRGPGGDLHPIGAGVFGAGCNMAFEVSAICGVGGFDVALDTGPPLPGGGDLDGFFKILDSERVLVYEPRMAVFHRHRRELHELRRQYHSWGTGFAAFLAARWQDPDNRPQICLMSLWWLRYQARQLGKAVDAQERAMVLSELAGGISGACGGYRRSRRRMAQRLTAD